MNSETKIVREWIGQDGRRWALMAYWIGTGWQYVERLNRRYLEKIHARP